MAEDRLVSHILSEADISARHGQYDRLVALANEVAALRDARDAARAEVAGLRETVARLRKGAIERRTRMNNLRAKVEGLPQEAQWTAWGTLDDIDVVRRDAVLTLIEEAQHG